MLVLLSFLFLTLIPAEDGGSQKLCENAYYMMQPFNDSIVKTTSSQWIKIKNDITIAHYFSYIDAVVSQYDSLVDYPLSEHLLIRANPRIINTLANTDYYIMTAQDSIVYDQRKMIILKAGDSIMIPDIEKATLLLTAFDNTRIDINIPEYRLRIYQEEKLLYTFPIRVGQYKSRYLAMGDRLTDLRTKQGTGKIVRHERNPAFFNPVTGERFFFTKRDDNRTTIMPQIPWIETEINGTRNGQMIHPTTNPKTLNKAYSNGCIGTRESDAWIIYYYAPLETSVTIRYDLKTKDEEGTTYWLKDIYGYQTATLLPK